MPRRLPDDTPRPCPLCRSTAVLLTRFDTTVPVRRQRALAEAIPDSRLWEIDGAHDVCATDPPAFVPHLVDGCRHVTER